MKYRTKRVQLRQKAGVIFLVLSVATITATAATSAIAKGDRQLAELKEQLEQPTTTPDIKPIQIPQDHNLDELPGIQPSAISKLHMNVHQSKQMVYC